MINQIAVPIPNNQPPTRRLIKTIDFPADATGSTSGAHTLTFEYEKTAASYPAHCPHPWECQTALTGITDEEERRWATWDYRNVLPIVRPPTTVHHMAWAYLGYHGTAAENEDHVETRQLNVAGGVPEDATPYDDKFIVVTSHGLHEVYNFDHTAPMALGTENIPPRLASIRDLRFWDSQNAPIPENIEEVHYVHTYYSQVQDRREDGTLVNTSSNSDSQDINDRSGLIRFNTIQGAGSSPADRVRIEYDYHRDEDDNDVPDRLMSRKTESGLASPGTVFRVTDYEWNMGLREPSLIIVSKDGSVGTREFQLAYAYTPQGRVDTVTLTNFQPNGVSCSSGCPTRVVDYGYQYFAGSTTRVEVMTVDGPRSDVSDITTYTFTPDGFLASVVDPSGNETQWSNYNSRGQPGTRTDPDGTVTTYVYNPRGWLHTRSTGGQTWIYQYWRNGLIKRIDSPDGDFLKFEYNAARKLISIENSFQEKLDFNRTFETSGSTRTGVLRVETLLQQWDGNQYVLRGKSTSRFDARGRLFEVIGEHGQKTRYAYEIGNRIKSIVEEGHVVGDLTTSYGYDGLHRVTSASLQAGTGIAHTLAAFEYNLRNQITKVTDSEQLQTDYLIDGFGDLLRITSPDSGVVDYQYDDAGNRTQENRDVAPGVVSAIIRTYDESNRILTESTAPVNQIHSWYYDEADVAPFENRQGRLSRVVDNSGSTEFGYDSFGRTSRVQHKINSSAGLQALNVLEYNRDGAGNLLSIKYPSGRQVNYPRTGGRATLADLVSPVGGGPSGPLASQVSHFPMDSRRISGLVYGNGLSLVRGRDTSQRLVSYSIGHAGGSILDRSYEYDPFDHVQRIISNLAAAETQSFVYDTRHRLDAATGIYGVYDYNYLDMSDNRLSRIFRPPGAALSITETYSSVSGSNRLASVTTANPNSGASNVRSLQYDLRGNVTDDERSLVEVLKYAYNDRNRMTQVGLKVVPEPGSLSALVSGGAVLGLLARSKIRRRSKIQGRSVARRLRSGGVAKVGGLAVLVLSSAPSWAQSPDFDNDGIPDAYEQSTFDGIEHTPDLNYMASGDAALDFDSDGLNNLIEYQIGSDIRNPNSCGTLCEPVISQFTIDKNHIIESGIIRATVVTLNATAVRIEPGNIPVPGGNGTVDVPISSTGEIRVIAVNQNSFRMETESYDYYDETHSLTYNAANQRVRQIGGGTERLYVYGPGGEILAELTANGTPVVEYVYLDGEPLVQIAGDGAGSETHYVHASHLGTPEVMTNSAKAIVWEIHTEPFGEVYQETAPPPDQRARFPGQIADADTRINYNWHRYYDPSIGRYLQADPIGQAGGVNVYSYAANNPVSLIDPFGLIVSVETRSVRGSGGAGAHSSTTIVKSDGSVATYGSYQNEEGDNEVRKNDPSDHGPGQDPVTSSVTIPVPPGMTSDEFDDAVIAAFESRANVPPQRYEAFPDPGDPAEGNCHTTTRGGITAAGGGIPAGYDPPGLNPDLHPSRGR